MLIARTAGVPVGLANGTIQRNPAIFVEVFAQIDNVFVVERERGAGVGRALLAAFEAWATERRVDEMRLSVVASNVGARRFWERAGFEVISLRHAKYLR